MAVQPGVKTCHLGPADPQLWTGKGVYPSPDVALPPCGMMTQRMTFGVHAALFSGLKPDVRRSRGVLFAGWGGRRKKNVSAPLLCSAAYYSLAVLIWQRSGVIFCPLCRDPSECGSDFHCGR